MRKRSPNRHWRSYEIRLIRELWGICSLQSIATWLNSTSQQIYYVARKHNLSKKQHSRHIPDYYIQLIESYVMDYITTSERNHKAAQFKRGFIRETLCWHCNKACGTADCEWANKLKPVPGWDAIHMPLKTASGFIESYIVEDCPKFEPDPPRGKSSSPTTIIPDNIMREITNYLEG